VTLCRSTRLALWIGAFATFGAWRAGAQGTEMDVAAQFFEAGAAAAKKGEYRVCAEAFSEAYKRAPHGATIYNAGLCWESAKEGARAANDYREALRLGGLSDSQDQQAKKRLAALRGKLGELSLNSPHGVRASVGPISQQPIPFTTFVKAGDVEVKLEGPDGEIISRTVNVGAGDHQDLDLELPTDEPLEKPKKPRPETPEPSAPGNLQRTAGWVADNTSQPLHDRAVSRYGTAQAFWIGAGIGTVAGVTLILTAPSPAASSSGSALRLHLAPLGASASLTF
jgi:hypothetical protein